MIINEYTSYFHDGALFDVQHTQEQIVFFLESAEVDRSDVKDSFQLSEKNTIRGTLTLRKIISIKLNETDFFGVLEMKYDSGSIFDFQIKKTTIELSLIWENFPPKHPVNDFDTILIEAKEIEWKNMPDLHVPFW